ncbi:MAG: Gldg family protein [Phormidesmis sp.]
MKNLPQALKYLIWPGLMLVTAAVVIGVLNGWTVVAIALLVIGLMLLVAGIASGGYASGLFWRRRATQAGTNAAVSVLAVLIILAMVNFLGARYDRRIDLTEGQLLTLSPATQQVVKDLKQPAELLIFSPTPDPTDRQLLDNYRRFNPDFTYQYVDPEAKPQLAQQLGVQTGGAVFLRSGDRTTLVQRVSPQEPLTERQLTDKLAQLGQENVAVAYFLQGHGEYAIDGSKAGYFQAASQLKNQNYTVAPLDLATTGSTIPADADVLIIAGPQKELFANEVKAVQGYLAGGGSVLALIDPQDKKTGLEPLLSQWGVVAENALVIDTSGGGQLVGLGPPAPLVQDYGEHPITEAFGNGRSFFPVARPLQIKEVPGTQETPLLLTNPNSHAQPMTEGELTVDPNQEPAGPFALGVALSRPAAVADKGADKETDAANTVASAVPTVEEAIKDSLPEEDLLGKNSADNELEENAINESRLVVIGNSSFATDGLFDQQLNGDVFLNSVNWLSKVDSPVLSIRPKEATNRRFEMTVSQQIFLTLLALVIFPLAGIVSAGVLWVRRR